MDRDLALDECTGDESTYKNCKNTTCGSWYEEDGFCAQYTDVTIFDENGNRTRQYALCNKYGNDCYSCIASNSTESCDENEFPDVNTRPDVETTIYYCREGAHFEEDAAFCVKDE